MHFCSGLDAEDVDNRITLGEELGWLPGVTRIWLMATRGCRGGNAGGEWAPFAHTPSVLSNTAPVPQPVLKNHPKRCISQEFHPYPLVPGHWMSCTSCVLLPQPSNLQRLLHHVLGSHTQCIFHALETPVSESSQECVTTHLSTPWHRCLYWY